MSAWQPIEAAPKDGSRIDLWVVPLEQGGKPHRQPDAYWCDRDPLDPEDKSGCEGWWCPMFEKFAHEYPWKVTHWMPLPEPPSNVNPKAD